MEDIARMLTSRVDFTLLDESMSVLIQHVFSALPEPPVATAAPLSGTALAWGPDGGIDHISCLPPEILGNVVSRLPAKEAARTTVLSERWRRVWHSVPLALVDAHLLPSGDLIASVSRALAAHPGPFRCAYLTGNPMDAHRAEIARWLQLLASKGVEDLVFINCARTVDADLLLPATLFKCISLTRLYIGFWRFPDTTTLPPAAAFPHLRELGLCSLLIHERDLAYLLEKCPILVKLRIVASRCAISIRIRSCSLQCVEVCTTIVPELIVEHASRLERLLLWEAWGVGTVNNMRSTIRIGHAPNLRFIGFLVPGMHQLEIGNTIIKAGTKASPDTTVLSVQVLAIQMKFGARSEAMMLLAILRCFPNVETLYVQSENDNSGTSSTAKLNLKFWEEAGPIECIQHHIKKVVLRDLQGKRGELDFIKFIAERAQALEKLVVVMDYGFSPSDQVGSKLGTCIASSKWANDCCKVMVYESPFPHAGSPWCFRSFIQSFEPGSF